jgi:anti-sigma-K factor RskA
MASEHEYWQEQSEIFALGALDGQELKDFEAHLASGCPICEAYLRETRETLNLLHRSLRPITPPPAAKNRILQQITGEKVVPITVAQSKQTRGWQRITGTIAACLIGVVLAGTYYHYRYEPRHTVYSSVIELLRDPATRDHTLYGTGPTPTAKGRFLWNESGEGHIFVSDLAAAPQGKMYAVWTIAQQSAPRYVGTVETNPKGQGGLHIKTAKSERPAEIFAVTLEPVGTTAAPTGPMVLVSKQS